MRRLAFIFLIAIAHSSILYAGDAESVHLMVGRSAVLDVGSPIARVSLTSAEIADAMVTQSNQVLINGKMPGTISLFVWDRGGALKRYEVVVQRDLARLSEQLTQLFPGEAIAAQSNGKSVVLSGSVSKKDVIEKAVSVAAGYVEKKEDVVTLLQVRESGGTEQVLLHVRFAEVSRTALTELGANFFTGPNGYKNVLGRTTTQQFAAPIFDSQGENNKLVFSDFLNFFLWDFKHDLGTVIKALQTRGLFQSLAEPNLVAESGKEASFLAGGEFPVPVAQPSNGGTSVTIMFKEFGIRLNFTPIVNGDRVHLKVRPEVSTLDFANGVTLQGFRVPALSTRRTETELELQNGQTFAIAGLINNTMNKTLSKVPGIGDIPILGLLFQSQAAQKDRTELVVMITPEILPRGSNGVTPNLPKLAEPYLPSLAPKKAIEPPPPAFRPATGTAQAPATSPNVTPASPSVQPAMDPAAAAATLQALTPSTKPVVKSDTPPARPIEANTAAPSRKLTREEQTAIEHAKKEDRANHENDQRAQAAAAKQLAKQAEIDRKKAAEDQKAQAAAQKRQAEIDKAAQEVAAKRAAEEAKKQAEIDKKHQKAIAEAEAKLKAAQAAYESESARAKKQ
jgi:pilus assembly protein CpaC